MRSASGRKGRSAARALARRRTRGPFSDRLSNLASTGRHKSFRVDPSFFNLVIDSLAEYAILTLDRDLTISSWSAAAEKVFGYTEEEAIGMSVAPLFIEEDRRKGYPKREFDEALAKGRVSDERYHLAKGARRFWTYGLAFPLRDAKGTVRGYVKIVRDESERKRKDDALFESEERLRLAVEATGMATWDYRPDRDSLHISESGKATLGLAPDAAVTYAMFLSRFRPDDAQAVDQCIRSCLAKETSACEAEAKVVMQDGSDRWVIVKAKALTMPALGDEESYPRVIGLVVDSTEKKLIQLKAADLAAELERRVKERTASLRLANEELESFAYSASHDLRAPLRKIRLYCQAILESAGNTLDQKSRASFKRIQVSVADMNRLIDATLTLSRATTKRMNLEDVDLSRLAREISEELSNADKSRAVRFEIEPGLIVKGDADLLQLALRNMLDNAWKFTRRRPEARIAFGSRRQSNADVYFVRDNGAGFDMAHADRLFRPFERLHSTADFAGTGVGLGIVARVIRRHRGRLWAESRPDQGATFYFTLFSEPL